MIIEKLINLLNGLLIFVVGLLPDINVNIPSDVPLAIIKMFNTAWDYLPMNDILTIFGLSLLITNFKITWSLITRIWDALPFT